MSAILGINAYHGDAAACIVKDGKLLAAVEEERFRRIKHWAGFPSEAVAYCLREAKLRLSDVDAVAVNTDPRAGRRQRLEFVLSHRPRPSYVLEKLRTRRRRMGVEEELTRALYEPFYGRVFHVEHHRAHLASAYYLCPWQDAVAVSVDGFGDFASTAWGVGAGSRLTVEGRVYFPHSLGIFYETLTQFLGFPHYGDEYKVMGLAPYGKPAYVRELEQLVRLLPDGTFELDLRYFRHATESVVSSWDGGSPTKARQMFTGELEELLGKARAPNEPLEQHHRDLARSVQVTYERAFFHLLNARHREHPMDHVAIAGGCAFNSVANGKIALNTPFRRAYIQSAAGDAGGAVGAAMTAYYELGGTRPHEHVYHAYLGPSFSQDEIRSVLQARAREIEASGLKLFAPADERALAAHVARSLAAGKVVGWFQGRLEWGPRALGNRSILGDPRRADMKDILNLKIKRRESFRPFAPSVLRGHVAEWFEIDDEVPFMMKVFQVRPEKRALIPAVTHVDGSGRLQTVYRDKNPRYYEVIEQFFALTAIPMVLNTSFNENEPVVCRPEEALDCFLRTKMDLLVLENYCLERVES